MIETKRLILRKWKEDDLNYFTSINNDPKVMAYSTKLLNERETKENYIQIVHDMKYHGFGLYAVEVKNAKQFIGYIGLTIPPYKFWPNYIPCVEIGWRLDSNYWDRGYATEGANECIKLGFNDLNLKKIISMTRVNNHASIRVMEKIGMTKDNNFSNINFPLDYLLYTIKR